MRKSDQYVKKVTLMPESVPVAATVYKEEKWREKENMGFSFDGCFPFDSLQAAEKVRQEIFQLLPGKMRRQQWQVV